MAEIRVADAADMASGSSRRVEVDGHRIAIVRVGDDWYAIGDRCSHAEASLSGGEIDAARLTVECPKHGAAFSLATGEPCTLPATRPVPAYGVRIDGHDVVVEIP